MTVGDRQQVWLEIVVAGALTALAMLVLGPPLGDLLADPSLTVLPDPILTDSLIAPEPTELARFALAVIGAIALAAWIAYAPARLPAALGRLAQALAVVGPLAVVAILVAAWLSRSEPSVGVDRPNYFTTLAGVVALIVAGLIVSAAVRPPVTAGTLAGRAVAALRRRAVAASVAAVATGCFLLPGAFTDASLPDAVAFIKVGHLPALFSDFTAVGNGATPGVDFAAQYSTLLPYLLAPVLALTDYSPGAYTILATILSGVALLALWRALVLLARSELAGLALYIPVLAISLIPLATVGDERLANNSQYQILPERYLMPCLLAWLVARHLRGLGPRRQELIFALAGLGALNNPEFGSAAVVATFGALALAGPAGAARPRQLLRLGGRAAIGLGAAAIAVAVLDLVRSGSLPDPSLLTYYSRLFGSQGFGMIPMPHVGLYWALYITFAGALALGALRARPPGGDRATVGLLTYAGLFGLVAGGYYAGRSNSYSLIGLFPAWGFAVAILAWIVWRRLREAADIGAAVRRAGPLGLATLVGFGLAASTVTSVAAPWSQVSRIADHSEERSTFDLDPVERFVADNTSSGEPIAFIGQNGHLIAREAGVRNISLLGDPFHLIATEQLDDLLAALDDEGGQTVFTLDTDNPAIRLHAGITEYLAGHGYAPVAEDPALMLIAWRPTGG